MMQVGHCLVYQKDRRLPSVGRPITLDQVAIDFPELTLIGIHLGYPVDRGDDQRLQEASQRLHGGDAYAPKHWPPPPCTTPTRMGRTNSCSAPIGG